MIHRKSLITAISLEDAIIPPYVGEVSINSHYYYLRQFLARKAIDPSVESKEFCDYIGGMFSLNMPDIFYLQYSDSIEYGINMNIGIIAYIRLYNNFNGKWDNSIGLGSTVSDLYDYCITHDYLLFIEERSLYIEFEQFLLMFEIQDSTGKEADIIDLEEVFGEQVTEIQLMSLQLRNAPILPNNDFPSKWSKPMKEFYESLLPTNWYDFLLKYIRR